MSALNKKSFLTYLKEGGIYVVLLVLLAIIIFQDPTFLSLLNLSNILTQSSVRIIIALGVAGLIVTQGTDLSAGRQVGLAAVIAATMLQAVDNANKVFPDMATMPIPLVILLVCAIGAVLNLNSDKVRNLPNGAKDLLKQTSHTTMKLSKENKG